MQILKNAPEIHVDFELPLASQKERNQEFQCNISKLGTSFPWPKSLMGYNSKFLGISGPDRHRHALTTHLKNPHFRVSQWITHPRIIFIGERNSLVIVLSCHHRTSDF